MVPDRLYVELENRAADCSGPCRYHRPEVDSAEKRKPRTGHHWRPYLSAWRASNNDRRRKVIQEIGY